jgi:hypothetical protein
MSPGLAKRVSTSSNNINSSNCSNSREVTNTENSGKSRSQHSTKVNEKIEYALEKNMQKLNLAVAGHSKRANAGGESTQRMNLSKEDIELFTNSNNNGGAGYLTSDSLSSTPEHRPHYVNSKQIRNNLSQIQPYQLHKTQNAHPTIQARSINEASKIEPSLHESSNAYYLNQTRMLQQYNEFNQDYRYYPQQQIIGSTSRFNQNSQLLSANPISSESQSTLPAGMITAGVLMRNSVDREMTPDSIDNDSAYLNENNPRIQTNKNKSTQRNGSSRTLHQQSMPLNRQLAAKKTAIMSTNRSNGSNLSVQMSKDMRHPNSASLQANSSFPKVKTLSTSSAASCSSTSSSLSSSTLSSTIAPTHTTNGLRKNQLQKQHQQQQQQKPIKQFPMQHRIEQNQKQQSMRNSHRSAPSSSMAIYEEHDCSQERQSQEIKMIDTTNGLEKSDKIKQKPKFSKQHEQRAIVNLNSNTVMSVNDQQQNIKGSGMPVLEEGLSDEDLVKPKSSLISTDTNDYSKFDYDYYEHGENELYNQEQLNSRAQSYDNGDEGSNNYVYDEQEHPDEYEEEPYDSNGFYYSYEPSMVAEAPSPDDNYDYYNEYEEDALETNDQYEISSDEIIGVHPTHYNFNQNNGKNAYNSIEHDYNAHTNLAKNTKQTRHTRDENSESMTKSFKQSNRSNFKTTKSYDTVLVSNKTRNGLKSETDVNDEPPQLSVRSAGEANSATTNRRNSSDFVYSKTKLTAVKNGSRQGNLKNAKNQISSDSVTTGSTDTVASVRDSDLQKNNNLKSINRANRSIINSVRTVSDSKANSLNRKKLVDSTPSRGIF